MWISCPGFDTTPLWMLGAAAGAQTCVGGLWHEQLLLLLASSLQEPMALEAF